MRALEPVPYPLDPAYGVTRCGRVFRLTDWPQRPKHVPKPPFELSQRLNSHGYLVVGSRGNTRLVHRMVAETFLPRLEGCDTVAHEDGDKHRNDAGNLRWTTQAGNLSDMDPDKHNTRARGEQFRHAKLTDAMVEQARARVAAGERLGAIAKDYPVDRSVLGRAIKRRTWNHV